MIAAADEMDDLQLVAILEQDLRKGRARHHFEIALDRDLLGRQAQLVGQGSDGHAGAHPPMIAVDDDADRAVAVDWSRHASP